MTTSRRDFLKLGAAASLSTVFLPRETFARYEAEAESKGSEVVLRCCIMSDVHFTGEVSAKEVPRFRRALEFSYEYSANQPYKALDALMVVGDMSNHGNEKELTLFKKEMDAAVKPGTDTLLCMGNHEFYGGNQAFWKSVFGVEPNATYERNGFKFIAISPERGTMKDGDYLYMANFLEKELAAAYKADPEKPIFVFQHYPVSPTVYGGRGFDDWGAVDFFDTLQKYPTVVNFSGHTHYPINDPRCAWQGCFSAFGTGTLSYICHGKEAPGRFQEYLPDDGKSAQFYIMEVRNDNSVTLKPYDLVTDSFFDVVYHISKPGAIDSYVYTDKRYSTSAKPTWRERTTVKGGSSDPYEGTLEFKQATCPDVVAGYRADLERFDVKTNQWVDAGSRYFWSLYYFKEMPDVICGKLTNLECGSKYRGKITALNPFMRESDEAIPCEFETQVDPGAVDADTESKEPNANYYDLYAVDGKLENRAVSKVYKTMPFEKRGEISIVKDDELGIDVVEFNGKDQFYKMPCTEDDFKRLRRATIAAKFKLGENGGGAVFGNTQFGGLELYYDVEKKALEFWVSVNGSYHILRAPVQIDKYVDAFGSFDGKTLVLYIDGKEVARENVAGVITHPTKAAARAFCLGSDIAPNGGGESFFKGRVARARLFTWALTPEQVANLSK